MNTGRVSCLSCALNLVECLSRFCCSLLSCALSCALLLKFETVISNIQLASCTEEISANKQSELNLLTDEVDRAQARLLSLEREKVCVDLVLV